ncbi:hypothetical protein EV2_025842 [Malus domestica]
MATLSAFSPPSWPDPNSVAVRQNTAPWSPAPLSEIEPTTKSLFHVYTDLSDAPDLNPRFLAIASPPSLASAKGVLDFLAKNVAGSTAELLCRLKRGNVVDLSQIMGKGFNIDQIESESQIPG